MQATTAKKLIALNRRFYQKLAAPFSESRGRLQLGVLKAIEGIDHYARILDLGCGNGQLALELEKRGHQGPYVGVDFSEDLLMIAREKNYANSKARFDIGDLTAPNWGQAFKAQSYDLIFCFASLHHIPGRDMRLSLLKQIRELLKSDGTFMLSNWQFLNSERLKKRILAWQAADLREEDVDPGDYLLDWRSGGQGLRYAHQFSEEELADLAKASGFEVREIYYSDGETGNLGLYEMWTVLHLENG